MDYNKLFSLSPKDLANWLFDEFTVVLPEMITTIEDMDNAAKLLLQLSSYYSYLCALMSYAKIATREAKRSGDKDLYEDMVDRKEAVERMTESVKQQYSAVSRAVTIHIENNKELHMNMDGGIKG